MRQLAIIFLFSCGFLNAQTKDTLVIIDSAGHEIHFVKRACASAKDVASGKKAEYLDSITFGGIIINKYMQDYYLVVKNKNNEKLMEGDFFDQFACGKFIDYKKPGKKYSEGFFTMRKLPTKQCGKYPIEYVSEGSGTWTYYNYAGVKIRTEEYDPAKKTVAIKKYDTKGKIISEEFLKDGKPVKK